ncbi:MAG: sensor histidine kinase, partial [Bacteroidota bacterium]
MNGITAFYPKDIPLAEDKTPVLRLIEARTFQIKSGSYINHLGEFDTGRPVLVTPDDDYLDIRVSPLVYDDVNQIRYSWRIEGYSDNWVQQQSPLIRLHNLPYGEHKLRIRYSLQGNIWSENEIIIPVRVTSPFYLTWPFLALVLLMILLTAWIIGNRRAIQLKKANQRLEEEVRHRTRKIESDKQLIEHQARELLSLDEMKSRFFTNITHELRTPLTLILGPVQSILKSDHISKSDHASAEMIQRNAIRLLTLVEELLDLSRMEANKLVLAEKPVLFYQFLARVMATFAPYSEHRRVELKLKYHCPNNLVLMADEQKWEKIINNLLNNALKFTPGGGTIVIEVDTSEDHLVMTVTDTGSGIHPDDLPYIFDRYYQARNTESALQGGAGIGLSLCREYMKLFGGDITVQSTPGSGSRFTLRCPLKPVSETLQENTGDELSFPAAATGPLTRATPDP